MVASDRREESEQSEHAEEQQSEGLRHSEDGRNVTLSSLHTRLDGQEERIQRTLEQLLSFSAVLSNVREQVDNVKVRVGVLEAFAAARGDLDGTSTGASSVLPFVVQEQVGNLETRTAAEGIPTAASPVGTAGQHVTESASQEQIAAPQETDPHLKRKRTKTTIMKKAIFPPATNNADTQQGTEPETKDSADESARKLAPASQVSVFAKASPDNGSISDSSAESRTRKKANSTQPDSKPAAKPATGKAKSSSSDQSSDVGPSIRKKVANR